MREYLIDYRVFNKSNSVIKEGTMKVKNCKSMLIAKCKLDDFLRKKFIEFNYMVVDRCVENNDILNYFNDIFYDK